MSFRHTYITEYLYKHGRDEELKSIENKLREYGTVNWHSSGYNDQYGYFHGVIKDLNSYDTRQQEKEITEAVEKAGARIKIIFE